MTLKTGTEQKTIKNRIRGNGRRRWPGSDGRRGQTDQDAQNGCGKSNDANKGPPDDERPPGILFVTLSHICAKSFQRRGKIGLKGFHAFLQDGELFIEFMIGIGIFIPRPNLSFRRSPGQWVWTRIPFVRPTGQSLSADCLVCPSRTVIARSINASETVPVGYVQSRHPMLCRKAACVGVLVAENNGRLVLRPHQQLRTSWMVRGVMEKHPFVV